MENIEYDRILEYIKYDIIENIIKTNSTVVSKSFFSGGAIVVPEEQKIGINFISFLMNFFGIKGEQKNKFLDDIKQKYGNILEIGSFIISIIGFLAGIVVMANGNGNTIIGFDEIIPIFALLSFLFFIFSNAQIDLKKILYIITEKSKSISELFLNITNLLGWMGGAQMYFQNISTLIAPKTFPTPFQIYLR